MDQQKNATFPVKDDAANTTATEHFISDPDATPSRVNSPDRPALRQLLETLRLEAYEDSFGGVQTAPMTVIQVIASGGFPGKLPYGYRPGCRSSFPEVCPHEGRAVQRLFELRASMTDRSDRKTAAALSAEGYVTRNGNTDWTAAAVKKIRTNPIFIGRVTWPRTDATFCTQNERFRIVSDAMFDMANRKKPRVKSVRPSRPVAPTDLPSATGK